MSWMTLVTYFCIVILGLVWYSHASLRNKVHCVFRSASGTKVEKLRPLNSRHVIFEGRRYDIDTQRRTILEWRRGIHALFPTFIFSYDFSYYSPHPLDPNNIKTTWDSPSNRDKLHQEEALGAFLRQARPLIGKKQSSIMQWLPIIAIVGVIIVGFMVYQQGQVISIMQQQINNLAGLK